MTSLLFYHKIRIGYLKKGLGVRRPEINKAFLNYDSEADVLYIATKGGEEEFVEVAPGVNVELDARGEVIGIEILNVSKFFKPVAKLLYQQMQISES